MWGLNRRMHLKFNTNHCVVKWLNRSVGICSLNLLLFHMLLWKTSETITIAQMTDSRFMQGKAFDLDIKRGMVWSIWQVKNKLSLNLTLTIKWTVIFYKNIYILTSASKCCSWFHGAHYILETQNAYVPTFAEPPALAIHPRSWDVNTNVGEGSARDKPFLLHHPGPDRVPCCIFRTN